MIWRRRQKAAAAALALLGVYLLVALLSDGSASGLSQRALASGMEAPRRRVALLIYGVRMETLFETFSSIRRHVVQTTAADVFVYGREVPEYNTSGAVRAAFGPHLKGVHLGQQLEEHEINALLASAKRHADIQKVCGGSNLLKPGTLNGLVWSQLVYELASSYERMHGFEYDYMIFMRPDVEWFAPFPPLELLDAKHQIWLPTRTPWGGIPASLIVCPRGLCQHWASWWHKLRNGTIVDELEKANEWKVRIFVFIASIVPHNANLIH